MIALLVLGIASGLAAIAYAAHLYRTTRRANKRPGFITDQWRNQ